ncbi:MAG: hypothetical protein ACKOWE_03020 [Micrococcales bacterium]
MSFSDNPNAERDWEIIRDPNTSDLEKAHAYSRLSFYHYQWKNENETGLRYAEQAERLFRKVGDTKNVGDSLYHAGETSFRMKKYTKALDYYSKAADIFRSEFDQFYLAICVDRMGNCYIKLDQTDLGVQHYRNSALILEGEENWKDAADERMSAADTLNDEGNYAEAELEALLSISLIDKTESNEGYARAYNLLGRAYQGQGQYDLAIEKFDIAIANGDYEDEQMYLHASRWHKAECLYELGKLDECETNISLARKGFKKEQFGVGRAYCDFLEAKLAFRASNNEKAEALAQKSRGFMAHGDKANTAEIDHLLAEISLSNGNSEQAIERYEIALVSLSKLSNPKAKQYEVCIDYAAVLITTPQLQRVIDVLDLVPHVDFLAPKYQIVSNNLRARAHYLLSQFDRCLEVLEQVFAITGEDWQNRDYAYAIETKARVLADTNAPDALNTMQYAVNLLTSQGVYEARYLAQQLREMQGQQTN